MASPHFLKGASGLPGGKGPSRKEQQRAVEDGIDVVRSAIKQLLAQPRGERERHLGVLTKELEVLAGRVGAADAGGAGARRMEATRKVVAILEKASAKRP